MSVANTWFMGKKHDVKSFKEQNEVVRFAVTRAVTAYSPHPMISH